MRLLEMSKWGKRNKDTHCLGLRKGSRRVALCARFIDKGNVLEQTQHPSCPSSPTTHHSAGLLVLPIQTAGRSAGRTLSVLSIQTAGRLAGRTGSAGRSAGSKSSVTTTANQLGRRSGQIFSPVGEMYASNPGRS